MKPPRHRLRYAAAALALLLLGLWLAATALWQLGKVAVFDYKAVVVPGQVVDVRQKPFEDWSETLGEGNLAMPGDVSYQPWVRFTLPGGISAFRADLPADTQDYAVGQMLDIICLPDNPASARLNKGKFLWGAGSLRLGAGVILTLIGSILLRRLKGRRPAAPAADAPKPKQQGKGKKKSPDAPKGGSPAPRRRKKADIPATGDTAPKKKRSGSRKKKQAESPELPL